MTVRVIQVGLGIWGLDWATTVVPEVTGIELVGWAESDPDARKRAVAAGLPADRLHESLASALKAAPAEAVLATVPLSVHAGVCHDALAAGLHVLVEKPFTETLSEAAEVIAAAERANRLVAVSQNYRFFPAPQTARSQVLDGTLGSVGAVRVEFTRLFDELYRYFFLAEPLLSDMAIHHFDLMRYVLDDEPVDVRCVSWTEPDTPFEGRPGATCIVRFRKGTVVDYYGSWISRGPQTNWSGKWRMDGSLGTLLWTSRGAGDPVRQLAADEAQLYRGEADSTKMALSPLPHVDRAGTLDAFARAIASGKTPSSLSTAADNVRSLALVMAAIRSAANDGALVSVDDILQEVGL